MLTFGKLSSPAVEGYLNVWAKGRLDLNTNPLLRNMVLSRRKFMLESSTGPSLLPDARLHPRMTQNYVLVRVPFRGDMTSEGEVSLFMRLVKDMRGTVGGALGFWTLPADVERQVVEQLRG